MKTILAATGSMQQTQVPSQSKRTGAFCESALVRIACRFTKPHTAVSKRRSSGVNVLILRAEVVTRGQGSQRCVTQNQAPAAGGIDAIMGKEPTPAYIELFTPTPES